MNNANPEEYAALAYAVTSQYVKEPGLLRVQAERIADKIVVRFPGTHLKEDHGKLIGGKGKHFLALEEILIEFGAGVRVELKVSGPPGPPPVVEKNRWLDPDWNDAKDEKLRENLAHIVSKVFGWPVPVIAFSRHNRTHLIIQTEEITPELLDSFKVLWLAIGRQHGRDIVLNAQAAEQKAV